MNIENLITKSNNYLFLLKKVPKNIKVDIEAIKLNLNPNYKYLYLLRRNDYLYIYVTNKKGVFLPEGLLLSYTINNDGIYIFKNNDYYNVLIIKDDIIIKDFVLDSIDKKELSILNFQYNLEIKYKDYFIDKKKLDYLDLIKLNIKKFKLNPKLINKLIDSFLIATILVLVSISVLKFSYQNKYNELLLKNKELSKKTYDISKKIDTINQLNNLTKNIKQISNNNLINTLNQISFIVKTTNSRFSYFRNTNNNLLFTIDGNNSSILIEKLSNIKTLKDLQLVSEIKINRELKRFRFTAKIR